MKYNKQRWAALMITLMGTLGLSVDSAPGVQAAETQSVFIAHYEHNAEAEAVLLAKAKSLGNGNSLATALSSTVDALNQQISTLYTVEQGLVNTIATLPSLSSETNNKEALSQQRKTLQSQITQFNQEIRTDRKKKNKAQLTTDTAARDNARTQLKDLNVLLAQLNQSLKQGHPVSLSVGLDQLQTSISNLQQAVMDETKLWIVSDATASVTVTNP